MGETIFCSFLFQFEGFEKMERGLSERFHDRASPVKRQMDHMIAIGATPGLVNPQLNTMTSDVIKVTIEYWVHAREKRECGGHARKKEKGSVPSSTCAHPIFARLNTGTPSSRVRIVVAY